MRSTNSRLSLAPVPWSRTTDSPCGFERTTLNPTRHFAQREQFLPAREVVVLLEPLKDLHCRTHNRAVASHPLERAHLVLFVDREDPLLGDPHLVAAEESIGCGGLDADL